MTSPSERIRLSHPIPWHSSGGLTGFVTELSADTLILQPFDPRHRLPETASLIVSLDPQQSFALQGATVSHGEAQQKLVVTGTNERRILSDLLGQIRKDQHIEICHTQDVESSDRFTGFDEYHFVPEALPDLNFEDIDSSTTFLGRRFNAPLLITGMTGGIKKGEEINRRLAHAAAKLNIPMGIGSQRIALENPEYEPIFNVKRHEPGLFLIGNIGCAQLDGNNSLALCQRAVDMVEADALAIHVNVLQESVQVEGDRRFRGLINRIAHICRHLDRPVMIKEVGCGIAPATARRLIDAGVCAIDIGGRGGTSWGYIEGLRSATPAVMEVAETFRNWGIPTAFSLQAIRNSGLHDMPLVATGGIRDGQTAAKAVALGANLVGIGLPLLRAALTSDDAPLALLQRFLRELHITMMLTGSTRLPELSQALTLGQPCAPGSPKS